MCHVSYVICQVSCVVCHMTRVTYHLSLSPQPQPQTLTLLTPPLCTVGWFEQTKKNKKKVKTQKIIEKTKTIKVQRHANISDTLFCKKSPVHWEVAFPRWHRQTDDWRTSRLRDWIGPEGRCSDNFQKVVLDISFHNKSQVSRLTWWKLANEEVRFKLFGTFFSL